LTVRLHGGVEVERLARLCERMAERFLRGGRLIALGGSPADWSDARHVAVEFVHPVIVGKRALPALALTRDVALMAEPEDMVIGFGPVADELAEARSRGCLTIGFGAGAEWDFEPPSDDPFVRQELIETLYHMLWEHVHVFLEHGAQSASGGAASFLYPFLGGQGSEDVVEDVRRSMLMKSEEVAALREQTLSDGAAELAAAAEAITAGGRVLALGNGGSATDAMDLVADLRAIGRRAIDLSDDPAIITAIANDIGTEAIFARQVIAYGRPGDVLVALSTSGNSENVIAALGEARRRGLVTAAFVGYDGGRVAAESLADHVVVTRSQNIPRIQEAQASAYHALVRAVS
jgi:D-sedoheptulose 7-phosphate isomerase